MLDDEIVAGTTLTLENDATAECLVLRQAGGARGRIRIDRIRGPLVRSRLARLEARDFGATSRKRAAVTLRGTE